MPVITFIVSIIQNHQTNRRRALFNRHRGKKNASISRGVFHLVMFLIIEIIFWNFRSFSLTCYYLSKIVTNYECWIILYTDQPILSTNNAFRHKESISSLHLTHGTNQPPLVIFANYRLHHSIVLLKDFAAMSIHLYNL
ncbi:hypothetical protein D3C85_923640 [compost metagenome]